MIRSLTQIPKETTYATQIPVRRWGNGQAIRLSKEILEHLPNEVIGDILDEEDDEELILEWLNLFSKYKQKQILDEVSHDVITDVIGSIEDEDEKNAFTIDELAIILDMKVDEIRDILRLTGDDK